MKTFLIISILWAVASGKPSERIIGGVPANIEDIPYQVALLSNGFQNCGGSIISPDWVITAAHCVRGKPESSLSVRVGSSLWAQGGSVHAVRRKIMHPLYNLDIWSDYDYALLELSTPINLDSGVPTAIPLATSTPAAGSVAQVSGWGQDDYRTSELRRVEIPIVAHDDCIDAYGSNSISARMVCAGPIEGGKGSCYGDSGGPLVVDGELVGLVSWAQGCAQPNYPTVFADVANQREWIRENSGLSTPISLDSGVPTSIPLASSTPAAGSVAQVSGWGQDDYRTSELRRVEIPIVAHDDCIDAYGSNSISARMVCAGPVEGGKGSCYGDSGGPLVVDGELVGLVSWAQGCAQPNYPTVFADVANQREWIRENSGI